MVSISPFRGLRPHPDHAQEVVSLPYDVVLDEQARLIIQKNPKSFLCVVRSDLQFSDDTNPYANEIYQRAKQNLQGMIDKQLLVREKQNSYYIYRLNFSLEQQKYQQTGIVSLFSVEDYLQGRIKKHEMTRPQKEQDRTRHIQSLAAQTGLVYLLYHNDKAPKLTPLLDSHADEHEPLYDLVFEGIRHRLYRVDTMELTEQLTQAFAALDCVYIADGHHRAASAAKVATQLGPSPQSHASFLAAAFPSQSSQILPYNRVVQDLHQLTETDFLLALRQAKIRVEAVAQACKQLSHCQANMYLGHSWYRLQWELSTSAQNNPQGILPANVLQGKILGPILGIDDPRNSKRLAFIGGHLGSEGLQNLVENHSFAVAFGLPAVEVGQLLAVADKAQMMPPKSTWFEPKLLSGLLTHLLDSQSSS